MRKPRHADSQVMEAHKRFDAGFAEPKLCIDRGIDTATFYNWYAKLGGAGVYGG